MSDVDELRDSLRDAKPRSTMGGNGFLWLILIFPVLGGGIGFFMNSQSNHPKPSPAQIARAEAALTDPAEKETKEEKQRRKKLIRDNTYLAVTGAKESDPYIIASEQMRTHNNVLGKLRACGKKYDQEKYKRLTESFKRKNKSAYSASSKIVAAKGEQQAEKFQRFSQNITGDDALKKAGAFMNIQSMALNNAATFTNQMNVYDTGSYKNISSTDCSILSRDISLGKYKLKTLDL